MNRITAVAVVGCVLGGYALGRAQAPYMIYGHGTSSCGEWTQLVATSSSLTYFEPWLMGYVTGAGANRAKPLAKSDAAGIKAWMTNYCAAHPLDRIGDAGIKLVSELESRGR